jgi:hypothetical protein
MIDNLARVHWTFFVLKKPKYFGYNFFKNEKVNFIRAFLKLETYAIRIYIYIYIILSYSIFIEWFRLKKKGLAV